MKLFLIVSLLLLSACAPKHWEPMAITKTNFYEAHNNCTVKDHQVVGDPVLKNLSAWNEFMLECMAGQGFVLKDGK